MFARALYRTEARPAPGRRAIAVAAALLLAAIAPAWGDGPHKRSTASLTSTERTEYRILQDKQEKGRETIEKKVFDNNTIVFVIDASMIYGQGFTMSQHIELTVEEESYFPRSMRLVKKVMQPDSTSFEHLVEVDMFSNVAVVTSKLNNQAGSRRAVVPTGVAITDVGVLGYLCQTLFWYDRESGGGQRFQWLDPVSVTVNGGELTLAKQESSRCWEEDRRQRVPFERRSSDRDTRSTRTAPSCALSRTFSCMNS
jgi:hypothetical protein